MMTLPKDSTAFIARMLASGGDRRITPQLGCDANQYGATPYPRDITAFASSTANDISAEAFAHLGVVTDGWPKGQPISGQHYGAALDGLRARLRTAYGLDADTDIVFAPSGTDLEFVALYLARSASGDPVANILLGADEVGSGCILSAEGRYFAQETALLERVNKGDMVSGLDDTRIVDVPVRCALSEPCSSAEMAARIDHRIVEAHRHGRHPLVHVIHGSKTGLVLPALADIDAILARYGRCLTLVVDACQARLEATSVRAYLERDAIVFMTGSKFMGGPPFSGFAFIPASLRSKKALPSGFATIFRRGEWPLDWHGADGLDAEANPGLLLRLEAAVFELERFSALPFGRRQRVLASFSRAIADLSIELGAPLVGGSPRDLSLERATLATIDLTGLPGQPDIAVAQRWQRVLASRGIRLGQPVKCVRLSDGRWGGTLRISLSMPLIMSLDGLEDAALDPRLQNDMGRITAVLTAATRPVAA
jgi:hypothetical protein